MSKRTTVVIGIDGATFDLLTPWMQQGRLPNLACMVRNGASGQLRSVYPCNSIAAWGSFITGKNPGQHGMFGFLRRVEGSYARTAVNSLSIDEPTIWQIVNSQGGKVGLVNLPLTTPLVDVDGFVVADYMAQVQSYDLPFALPQQLGAYIRQRFGKYIFDVSWVRVERDAAMHEEFINKLYGMTRKREEVICHVLENYDCDLYILVFTGSDRIQHSFWKYMDPQHPLYNPTEAARYGDEICKYYQLLDEIIGGIRARCGSDSNYVVVSDHGFGPWRGRVHLNKWLIENGWLHLRKEFRDAYQQMHRRRIIRDFLRGHDFWGIKSLVPRQVRANVVEAFTPPVDDEQQRKLGEIVDWSKTKVYLGTLPEQSLYINLKGREPGGIVEPGEEYEGLRDELIRQLSTLQTLEGKHVFDKVLRKEEVLSGKHLEDAPDLLLVSEDTGYWMDDTFQYQRLIETSEVGSGIHYLEGVFIASGPHIKQGFSVESMSILDVAPTLLYMMALGIPEDMEGRVVTEILRHERPIAYVPPLGPPTRREQVLTDEDEARILKALRDLGYSD